MVIAQSPTSRPIVIEMRANKVLRLQLETILTIGHALACQLRRAGEV